VSAAIVNQRAVDVATLAQRMVSQYFSHVVAMHVARDPRAGQLRPQIESGQIVSVLKIPRRDGNTMIMSFDHYLAEGRNPEARDDFDKAWLVGALLLVGDALGANAYFGHDPEAEMIRHLRNGIAHGNHFSFHPNVINQATQKLKYPANIFRYAAQCVMPMHEIEAHMQGTEVLFVWGGPDAIIGHGLPIP
jgi:hypothetical protein